MIEIDPKVIEPDELINRIKTKIAGVDPNYSLEEKQTKKKFTEQLSNKDMLLLEQNVKFLHANWHSCDNRWVSSKRPLLGPVVAFVKKVCRKILARQVEFNGGVTRAVSDLMRLVQSLFEKAAASDVRVNELEQAFANRVKEQEEKYQEQLAVLQRQLEAMQEDHAYFGRKLRKIQQGEVQQEQVPALAVGKVATMPQTEDVEFDYILFENRYRGSRQEIMKRLEFYIPYFKRCMEAKALVLDIGCGRGEMVELLQQQECRVTGIDLSRDMVEYCQERNLPVQYGEALSYLQTVDDASLGAVFFSQVIEHIDYPQWLSILQTIYKKLTPGGFVVIETINPQSLFALKNAFYMDLSHVRPVHPATLSFAVESIGYRSVETLLLGLHPATNLVAKEAQCDTKEAVTALLKEVFGNQDYAVIAYR